MSNAMTQRRYVVFETPKGFAGIAWSEEGITGLSLPARVKDETERRMRRRAPHVRASDPPAGIAGVVDDVRRYFLGAEVSFDDVPLDMGDIAPFFSLVYAHVRALTRGETTTYGAVAKALGADPQAARDVGVAMATNPVPLIIPCHRVLAAGGRIGGFSAPGGSALKASMLQLECALPMTRQTTQSSFEFG